MRDRERERQRHTQREKQAHCEEAHVGIDPEIPWSQPEPKTDTLPLSHPCTLKCHIFKNSILRFFCPCFPWASSSCFCVFWECLIFCFPGCSASYSLERGTFFLVLAIFSKTHMVFFFSLLPEWVEISPELVFSTDRLYWLLLFFTYVLGIYSNTIIALLCTVPSPLFRLLISYLAITITLKSNGGIPGWLSGLAPAFGPGRRAPGAWSLLLPLLVSLRLSLCVTIINKKF